MRAYRTWAGTHSTSPSLRDCSRALNPNRTYTSHTATTYPSTEATAATCDYTLPYTAALEQDNIFGVQFHPEKSGAVGMKIVQNFLEL